LTDCYFARYSETACQGVTDRCHIVRQQDIRRRHELANPRRPPVWHKPDELTGTDLEALLSDQRNIVPGCRHHHANADVGFLEYDVPASAYEFAAEYGLDRYLP
jgi:hypothetical protein